MTANRKILLLLATVSLAVSLTNGEVKLITKPEPGQEYVFLQTSAAGSRPVERKEKPSQNARVFETAHKLPPSLTFALKQAEAEEGEIPTEPKAPIKTVNKAGKPKREALPAEAPLPAPAGAIKLDVQALLAKYKTVLQTSTTAKPATSTTKRSTTRSTRKPRLNPILGNKRTKKEALEETVIPTTASSVLTTSSAGLKPIERDDDVPLVASGSEKQRSRIQIKKGPNGQEYEYEYVYYYYDDDDAKQSNAHDGPARNEITPQSTASRGSARGESKGAVTPEPASNEVLPTSKGRTRGRQLDDEDVADERLPANTRFPPRSRNLNTTPSVAEETVDEVKPRGRGRGRPEPQAAATSAESNSDSVSDETQGSRGRTRANVRRPSLDLVDNASFNTHTSSGEPPSGSGPTFPADLPAGPVRFLGATPNERMDLQDKKDASGETDTVPAVPAAIDEATTMMSAMDKVALDLYAILQGTQRLSGEESEGNTEMNTEADVETTTLEATTEIPTTEALPSTTTTTTTTTTQAPSTAAPESVFGRGKYRTRPAIGGRKAAATTTTTEAPASSDGKPKSRFNRPSFGSRPRARPAASTPTETEPEQKETKEEAKPVSATRTRTRFGAARTRVTTATPEETGESKAPATTKPSLRPRPTFNLRGRTRPSPAPETESSATEEGQEASTTARSRLKLNASNVRPLRPGPRLNLSGGRGRLGVTTAAPAENPAEPAPVVEEDQEKTHAEEGETKEAEATPAPDSNPLSRLRNRQRTPLQVRPAAPKAAASAPVQVRRANPLISRRKPIGEASTTEAASPAEAAHSAATDAPSDAEEGATDAASSTTSTTEEPKGLNKLLKGRRRLTLRQPGTVAA